MSKAGRCYHGKASKEMEEKRPHALEVGSEADAAQNAKDQAESWRLVFESVVTPQWTRRKLFINWINNPTRG